MIHWLTTSPNPRARAVGPDYGQRGWRLHAVEGDAEAQFSDVSRTRSACGLRPRHGWGLDLFIEDRCVRCTRAMIAAETAEEAADVDAAQSEDAGIDGEES